MRLQRFRFQHRAYLHNQHGIKKFAEKSLEELVLRVTKKSAFYREMNENLLVEKANLCARRDELYAQKPLEGSRFFSTRRELWANTVLTVLAIAIATLLGERAVAVFVSEAVVLRWLIALLLAVVLTGGGMVLCARLLNALAPNAPSGEAPSSSDKAVQALLWGVLLLGIEIILFGLADARRFTPDGAALHLSYVTATMLIPLVAGALRWHHLRFIDPYKSTLLLRRIEDRLAQIDSILRQNEEFENNFYKLNSIEYWGEVNAFKTIKENVNQRKEMAESLDGHFAQNYDLFQAEARKRYTQDVLDVAHASFRKIDPVAGNGQQPSRKNGSARPALQPASRTQRPTG